MIDCIIIEDQPPAQRILKKYISEVDILCLKDTFTDAVKAMEYLKAHHIGLIFLDIHLPKISGIDFLRTMPNHPMVILTTAFSEYALESYRYNVVDYLLKPISEERFIQAIAKLRTLLHEEHKEIQDALFLKSGHELIKISPSQIIYIKADSNYTEITTTHKTYLSKDPLRHWLEKLDGQYFCQIHKSYLINIQHLVKVSGNIAYLTNTTLPLGRAFKKNFLRHHVK